jgi:hypothetical protein
VAIFDFVEKLKLVLCGFKVENTVAEEYGTFQGGLFDFLESWNVSWAQFLPMGLLFGCLFFNLAHAPVET